MRRLRAGVAAHHPVTADAALEVLADGGTAADAAVAGGGGARRRPHDAGRGTARRREVGMQLPVVPGGWCEEPGTVAEVVAKPPQG